MSSTVTSSSAAIEQRIRAVFAEAGATGFLHVREIGVAIGVDVGADTVVAVASVVKILIAEAFARAVVAGAIDPTERVVVPARLQVGGTGTAGCSDPVEMSLRDLALFMMNISDNAATDVVAARVGSAAIDQVIDDLGLDHTQMVGDMDTLRREVLAELGLEDVADLDAVMQAAGEKVWKLALIDPERTNRATPRDVGLLLEAIWTDRAGTPEACAAVRELMSHQVTGHRLAAGFGDDVTVASKTGTLPAVRNEAGVLTYSDGRRYVAAVFTRARTLADRLPAIDAAIGRCARIAIDELRRGDNPSQP
jgi:beta-lactamase class A